MTAAYRIFGQGLSSLILALLVLAGCGRTSLSLYEDGGPAQEGGVNNEAGVDAGDAGDSGDLDASDSGSEGGIEGGVDSGDGGGLCDFCNDGIPCTDDQCDPVTGACTFVPDSTRCAPGQVCVRDVGCSVVPCRADEVCADGFFCNGAERCSNGVCVAGRPVECASSQCQVNRCDELARNCVGTWRDDDRDGHSPISCMGDDCDDNNRLVFPGAREICTDGRDNDCNARVDCDDARCSNAPACNPPPPTETNCRNGVDDDFDGLIDCSDSDCFNRPVCQMQMEICDDGRDNDFDNAVDCDDSDCVNDPACVTNLCDGSLGDPRAAAREACAAQFGPNCVDTGSASFIGFAPPSTQGSNCDVGLNRWAQFCYADAEDTFNCNTCQVGAIKLAHSPCTCGDNTETVGDFCDPTTTCPSLDLGSRQGRVATGVTTGRANDLTPSCIPVSHSAPDITHRWRAPSTGTWTFDTIGSDYDAVLYVLTNCGGPELACDDDAASGYQARASVALTAGQSVIIVVDGYGSSNGRYALNIGPATTTEANLCWDEIDNDIDGTTDCQDFDCWMDPFCLMMGGERGRCSDGIDNDFDGLIDCEDQVDCWDDSTCFMGSERGFCADLVDNDFDGAVDCADSECVNDPACVMQTECPAFDLGSRTGSFVAQGSTSGQRNDLTPFCVFSNAPEVTYRWRAPRAGTWQIDTGSSSFDTALYVLRGGCDGDQIACNDDGLGRQSIVTVNLVRGEEVVIVVDGWSSSVGSYVLNISSLISNETGQCTDGVDNDNDASVDCFDSDCLNDVACLAPECPDAELGSAVGAPVIADTTLGQGNDFTPSCLGMSSVAPDVSYRWRAPLAGRWLFDTFGSQYDTALSVLSGDCDGQTLACNDDSGGGRDSSVTINLTRGQEVVIVVDGWSSSAGNYVLNIGRIVTNERGQCADFVDNDGDGARDCDDNDCADDFSCVRACDSTESGLTACTDGRDNDCDMLTDCVDPDCNAIVGGECCNGADDDGDGLIDLLACACQSSSDCAPIDSPIGVVPGVCWPSLGVCGPDCSAFGVQAGNAICRFINPALTCQRSTGQCVITPQP